jgi:two-component system response regulator AlgR
MTMTDSDDLKILIADDEPLPPSGYKCCWPGSRNSTVGTAHDGESAVRMAEALAPNLVLLDIAMPGLDGMEVARALSRQGESPAVVFVTAFDQFAVAAFDVAAIDYLMKPVDAERMARSIDRARAYLTLRANRGPEEVSAAPASPWLEEFWASDLSGLVRIASRDIDRVTAERDYMRLHVGKRSWLIHHSMAALEEGLDPELFVRLHRSAIVRRDFIAGSAASICRWIARLADGNEQPGGPPLRRPVRADRWALSATLLRACSGGDAKEGRDVRVSSARAAANQAQFCGISPAARREVGAVDKPTNGRRQPSRVLRATRRR